VEATIIPAPHPDTWVNLLHGYVAEAVRALARHEFHVHRSWLDPADPRDATIVCSDRDLMLALVWDEESGWRRGSFVDGGQGRRTVLSQVAYLGGGVLPEPDALAHRITTRGTAAAPGYRRYGDVHDGLDDALRRWQ